MLTQKLQDDLLANLKAQNTHRVEVLRLIRSELKNAEIDNGAPLQDEQTIQILKKYAKKLQEAADMFEAGGRNDLAQENIEQKKIVAEYLPEEMNPEKLQSEIIELAREHTDLLASNKNAFIGIAMKKYASQANPQKIMEIVKEITSQQLS